MKKAVFVLILLAWLGYVPCKTLCLSVKVNRLSNVGFVAACVEVQQELEEFLFFSCMFLCRR